MVRALEVGDDGSADRVRAEEKVRNFVGGVEHGPPYGLPRTKALAAALSLDFIDKGGLEGASPPAAGASTESEPAAAGGAAGSAGVAGAVTTASALDESAPVSSSALCRSFR